ncbi:MAG TPA: hypothetical protein VEX39_00390 [Thermoleophilaceae bacterium]|nr:hypothetical protein [Thermoleophilaceae bacterium]
MRRSTDAGGHRQRESGLDPAGIVGGGTSEARMYRNIIIGYDGTDGA